MYSYEKFRAYQWLLDFNAFLLIDMKLVRIFQIRTIINWYVTTVPISWCSWQESQLLSANLLFSSFLGIIHDDIHLWNPPKKEFSVQQVPEIFRSVIRNFQIFRNVEVDFRSVKKVRWAVHSCFQMVFDFWSQYKYISKKQHFTYLLESCIT